MASIHRCPLKLVTGRGISIFEMGIGERIDLLHPSPVQFDSEAAVLNSTDRPEVSIHHVEFPVVPGEEDSVSPGKLTFSVDRPHPNSLRSHKTFFPGMKPGPFVDIPGLLPCRDHGQGDFSFLQIPVDPSPI